MTSIRLRILAQTLPFLLIAPAVALAQTPPSRAEANTALHASANPSPSGAHFTRQQLDQVLAPIALYPDELLSNVLMAATYPQQILDANQWLQDPQHKDLKGDALAAALEPPPWDPSVKALMPFPQIIAMMADHIEWAQALGTAFAEDQAQVMARIQELRHLAMKSGKLKTVRHLNVREEGGEVVITSAEPDRIYVPIYNPRVIYGEAWPDRDYLPVYLPPPPGFVAETIEPGIEISSGYAVVRPLWGWSHPDWREHRITIERDRYTRITRNAELPTGNVWRHEGPVVAVTNAPRTTTTTTQVPAGTVAPASVARQGQAAQNGNQAPGNAASAPPNANQPAAQTNKPSSTATGQPQPAQPGQAAGAASQPGQNAAGTAKPGETSTGTNKPAQSATGANTPTDKGKANQAEQKAAPTAHPAEPAKSGTNAANPATPAAPAGNAARQDDKARPGAHEGAARAPEHANTPAAKEEPRRDHAAPAPSAAQEPARTPEREPNRPNAAQAPAAAPAPGQAERRAPEHQPAAPSVQAERPAAPHQPAAQGSSTPAATAPQPPKGAAAPQPPKGGTAPGHEPKHEEDQKKE